MLNNFILCITFSTTCRSYVHDVSNYVSLSSSHKTFGFEINDFFFLLAKTRDTPVKVVMRNNIVHRKIKIKRILNPIFFLRVCRRAHCWLFGGFHLSFVKSVFNIYNLI